MGLKKGMTVLLAACMIITCTACSGSIFTGEHSSSEAENGETQEDKTAAVEEILEKAKAAYDDMKYLEVQAVTAVGGVTEQELNYIIFHGVGKDTIYEESLFYNAGQLSYGMLNYYESMFGKIQCYTATKQLDSTDMQEPASWFYTEYDSADGVEECLEDYYDCLKHIDPDFLERYAMEAIELTEENTDGTDCYVLTYDSAVVTNATVDETVTVYLDKNTCYPIKILIKQDTNPQHEYCYTITNINFCSDYTIPQEVLDLVVNKEETDKTQ